MRIAFIGAGAMATAIARGAVAAGLDGAEMVFTDLYSASAQALAESTGGRAVASNIEALDGVDFILLAVKPHVQRVVIEEIRGAVKEQAGVCVISIAAGRSVASIDNDFGGGVAIVRVMPNVNAQIGESMTGMTANSLVSEAQMAGARELFEAIGRTVRVDEKDFPVFSALAGCSPAWTFQIIDDLARAGVKYGIPKARAVAIVAQALAGSATMVLEAANNDIVPAQLIDQVTSPGGTTIAGLLAAQEAGLDTALIKAVDAAVARDRELG